MEMPFLFGTSVVCPTCMSQYPQVDFSFDDPALTHTRSVSEGFSRAGASTCSHQENHEAG